MQKRESDFSGRHGDECNVGDKCKNLNVKHLLSGKIKGWMLCEKNTKSVCLVGSDEDREDNKMEHCK